MLPKQISLIVNSGHMLILVMRFYLTVLNQRNILGADFTNAMLWDQANLMGLRRLKMV